MKKLPYIYLIAIILIVFSFESTSEEAKSKSEDTNPVTYEIAEEDILFSMLQSLFGQSANIIVGGDLPVKPDHIITALSEALNKSLTGFIMFLILFRFIRWVAAAKSQGGADVFDFQHAPLPILFAIVAIIPVKGGVSFLQMVTIEAAGYSIKISNYETNLGAKFLEKYGSFSSLTHVANIEENAIATVIGSVCKGIINKKDKNLNVEQVVTSVYYDHYILGDRIIIGYAKNGNPIFYRPTEQIVSYVNSTLFNRSGVYKNINAAEENNKSSHMGASAGRISKSYPEDVCGNSKISFPPINDEENSLMIREYRNAVEGHYRDLNINLAKISAKIVNDGFVMVDEKYLPMNDQIIKDIQNQVSIFKSRYQTELAELVSNYSPSHASDSGRTNDSTAADVLKKKGTAYLGVYYLEFMKKNAKTLEATKLSFSQKMPNSGDWDYFFINSPTKIAEGIVQIIKELKSNVNANLPINESEINKTIRLGHEKIADIVKGENDNIWQFPTELVVDTVSWIMNNLIDENDPVSGLINTGHYIIGSMESFYLATQLSKIEIKAMSRIAKAAKQAAQGLASDIPFGGGTAEGVVKAIWVTAKWGFTFIEDALSLTQYLILPVLLAGIFLAFWLPAIPMIHWINTMIGFLIITFNTFILVPAQAISHLITTDNKFIGQKTNHGYMAILQLLLYLPFVVIAFFGSLIILMAGTKLIQLIFIPTMLQIIGNSMAGLLTMFFALFLFIGINIQMFNRCFALLSSTPEKLNEYIGGGAEMLDDKDGVSGTKAIITNVDSAAKESVSTKRMQDRKNTPDGGGSAGAVSGGGAAANVISKEAEKVNKSVT